MKARVTIQDARLTPASSPLKFNDRLLLPLCWEFRGAPEPDGDVEALDGVPDPLFNSVEVAALDAELVVGMEGEALEADASILAVGQNVSV